MNKIKELRLARGWRQQDLADQMHIRKATISRYETGTLGLDAEDICALCDIFEVTADYLLGRSSSPLPVIPESDAALLRAYHAATLRDRALVDQILAAYIDAAEEKKAIS